MGEAKIHGGYREFIRTGSNFKEWDLNDQKYL
jgi:hypothetical protein